eukprot:scaffold7328_cov314-Pinguiococcus_pyrenoidosus.AAC.85
MKVVPDEVWVSHGIRVREMLREAMQDAREDAVRPLMLAEHLHRRRQSAERGRVAVGLEEPDEVLKQGLHMLRGRGLQHQEHLGVQVAQGSNGVLVLRERRRRCPEMRPHQRQGIPNGNSTGRIGQTVKEADKLCQEAQMKRHHFRIHGSPRRLRSAIDHLPDDGLDEGLHVSRGDNLVFDSGEDPCPGLHHEAKRLLSCLEISLDALEGFRQSQQHQVQSRWDVSERLGKRSAELSKGSRGRVGSGRNQKGFYDPLQSRQQEPCLVLSRLDVPRRSRRGRREQ